MRHMGLFIEEHDIMSQHHEASAIYASYYYHAAKRSGGHYITATHTAATNTADAGGSFRAATPRASSAKVFTTP